MTDENFIDTNLSNQKNLERKGGLRAMLVTAILILVGLVSIIYYSWLFLQAPPTDFPLNQEIEIVSGTSLREAVKIVKNNNLIRSEIMMYFNFILEHSDKTIKAGTYVFSEPLNVAGVAEELIKGNPKAELLRFTHIEGERIELLAKRAENILPNFNAAEFLVLAKNSEGKLFPETYLIPRNYTAEELFLLLEEMFSEKINELSDEINSHTLSLDEIITLASIIEREANSTETKKMVSGILQNRLRIGMALQADASIEYVLDKPLSELTSEDLKIDSPFNTYINTGLPPHPIGNPGIEAIKAVLNPTPSKYLFYITGNDGDFYYAENFDEHRLNIAKYLR